MNNLFCNQESKTAQCNQHGEFISKNIFRETWTKCPQCAADQQATEQREALEREAIVKHKEWQRKLGEAAIPERFRNRTLHTYRATNEGQKRALAFAAAYAANFDEVLKTGRSAIFCGMPGTGKTHLAIGIALSVMLTGKLAMFTTAARAIRRVKDSWSKDSSETEGAVIRLLVQPDLLILDEIGVQFGSEFEKNLLFDIMNERYEKHRPTLLLSNLAAKEIKAFLGERVYDRLKEDGGQAIVFNWESQRGAA